MNNTKSTCQECTKCMSRFHKIRVKAIENLCHYCTKFVSRLHKIRVMIAQNSCHDCKKFFALSSGSHEFYEKPKRLVKIILIKLKQTVTFEALSKQTGLQM